MKAIQVDNLSKTFKLKLKEPGLKGSITSMFSPQYKNVEAVKNLSFEVNQGETLAFIGPNGAGKSTSIKMMTGILHPSNGDIRVLGKNPMEQRKELAYKVGSVFGQKSQLWFHLPPVDTFMLLGKIYEVPDKVYKERVDYLTEIFEIEELMTTPVRKMSLGQRIRCEIAASLLHKPEIIFLDEPTIGLDVVVKQRIRDLIRKINKEEGTTIFLTSHDSGDIEQLCKRVIIINHGKLVLDEKMKQLKQNYLSKKIINIKYAEAVTLDGYYGKVLKDKGYAIKVEVDTYKDDLHQVINRLMALGNVIDVTIEDAPLEEIISDIYQRQRGELNVGSV